jgi:hypothetical protein
LPPRGLFEEGFGSFQITGCEGGTESHTTIEKGTIMSEDSIERNADYAGALKQIADERKLGECPIAVVDDRLVFRTVTSLELYNAWHKLFVELPELFSHLRMTVFWTDDSPVIERARIALNTELTNSLGHAALTIIKQIDDLIISHLKEPEEKLNELCKRLSPLFDTSHIKPVKPIDTIERLAADAVEECLMRDQCDHAQNGVGKYRMHINLERLLERAKAFDLEIPSARKAD